MYTKTDLIKQINPGMFWSNLCFWKICSADNQALKRSQASRLLVQEIMVTSDGHTFLRLKEPKCLPMLVVPIIAK